MVREKPNTWETKRGAVHWLEVKPRGPANSKRKQKGRDSYSKHKRLEKSDKEFEKEVASGLRKWIPGAPGKLGYWISLDYFMDKEE